MEAKDFFQLGHNCWRSDTASFASPIVDGADYFRALHESISKAEKTIFIVGWDIDSRIELIRGEEVKDLQLPSQVSDLIAKRASDNPELKIYLLRWDSSLAFFKMREVWAKEVWDNLTPSNVYTELDDTIPMGGSQHQKVVVIDDELAYSGGMDIAVHRWDTREHKPDQALRIDPDGPYVPLHDVHSVVAGPIVKSFSELVRWRWNRIPERSVDAPELDSNNQVDSETLPKTWPESVEPCFKNIRCGIARTIPLMDNAEPAQEVRQMLLSVIEQAEDFIYIENQFASRQEIAEAINKRLKACPRLRVLLVSSYNPKSMMECEAYWSGRIDFKEILEKGVDPRRVLLSYAANDDGGGEPVHKRIHSKVLVVDDKILIIGSANISNRSMTLDTECDLVFAAATQEQQEQIRHFRNDLVSEHSGWSIAEVDQILAKRYPFKKLNSNHKKAGYHLNEVEDHIFTDQSLYDMVQPISDPEEPLVSQLTWKGKRLFFGNPSKKTIVVSAIILGMILLVCAGYFASKHISWLDKEHIEGYLEATRGTMWALPAVVAAYVIGGIFFFPVTVLSIAVAAIFGPVWGPVYGICGAVASATLSFYIGRVLGGDSLKKYGGKKVQALDDRFRRSGVLGVAALRLVPIAPFSLVNLVAGVTSVHIYVFALGTFFGMLPQMIVKGLVGDSLLQIFKDPKPSSIAYLLGGIVLWGLVIYASQKAVAYFQNRANNTEEQELATQ